MTTPTPEPTSAVHPVRLASSNNGHGPLATATRIVPAPMLLTLAINADASHRNIILRPDVGARHKPDGQVIEVERIVQMERIDEIGDFENLIDAVAAVGIIRAGRLFDTEERYDTGQVLRMILRIGVLRQIHIDIENRSIVRALYILQI